MADSIRSIVLGVAALAGDDPGGSTHQDPAFASAAALARSLGATLHAVHAFELPAPALAGLSLPPPDAGLRHEWAEEVGRRLCEQAARFPGVEVKCHAVEGSPAVVLCEIAARLRSGLLVVGATRRGRLWRGILGSTAEGVLRAATVPVLVLHQSLTLPLERILLTTDLSDESRGLLRRSMDTIRLLATPGFEAEVMVVVASDPMITQPVREAALVSCADDAVRRIARELGPRVAARVRVGEPAVEILREAEEWKADLVVLGTYGRSGYRPLWLGSTATAAARAVGCNVLMIPGAAGSGPSHAPAEREEPATAALA